MKKHTLTLATVIIGFLSILAPLNSSSREAGSEDRDRAIESMRSSAEVERNQGNDRDADRIDGIVNNLEGRDSTASEAERAAAEARAGNFNRAEQISRGSSSSSRSSRKDHSSASERATDDRH